MRSLLAVYVGLLVLAPAFWLLERLRPATPVSRTRRALFVDLGYWLVTPLATGTLSRGLVLGLVALFARLAGHDGEGAEVLARLEAGAPIARLPLPAQLGLAVVLADLLGYWSHRARHRAGLWRLHAVHHGAEELTALAAARMHPLDEMLDAALIDVPLLLLGFPFPVVAALGPFFVLHTLLLHANVPWGFGPLAKVLASPRFHRRHHARELPPANYAGVFSAFDVLFGTFDLPARDAAPFGVPARDVPESLLGQLAYPLLSAARSAGPADRPGAGA